MVIYWTDSPIEGGNKVSAEATPGKKGPGGEPRREVWENLGEAPKLSDSHAVGARMFFGKHPR